MEKQVLVKSYQSNFLNSIRSYTCDIRFGLLSKPKSSNERIIISPVEGCRDYISDLMTKYYNGKSVNETLVFPKDFREDNIFIDEDNLRLLIVFYNRDHVELAVKNSLAIVNAYEELFCTTKSTLQKVSIDDNKVNHDKNIIYELTGPGEWTTSSNTVSCVTMIFKLMASIPRAVKESVCFKTVKDVENWFASIKHRNFNNINYISNYERIKIVLHNLDFIYNELSKKEIHTDYVYPTINNRHSTGGIVSLLQVATNNTIVDARLSKLFDES